MYLICAFIIHDHELGDFYNHLFEGLDHFLVGGVIELEVVIPGRQTQATLVQLNDVQGRVLVVTADL